jgi:hypothetical protein
MKTVAVIAIVGLALTGCSSSKDEPTATPVSSTSTASGGSPKVSFFAEGEGTKSGSITMRSESGGTIQKDVALPMGNPTTGEMGISSDSFKHGDFLYISLQNSEASGSVTCRIEVDGVKLDEETSSGGYKVVSCQAQLP